jgi:phage gpG-like protein
MTTVTGFRAKVTGVPELEAMFKRVRGIAAKSDGLAEAMAGRFVSRIQFRYDSKTDPNGKKWAPISALTRANLERRASLTGDGSIPGTLLDRHNPGMRSSLTRAKIGRDWMVGFSRKYAIYHEFGTKYMDRRGLIFADPTSGKLSQKDLDALLDAGNMYLSKALGV